MSKPIIVGESNPYGGDDEFALYPSPDGCSGHRLCCLILGMRRKDYLEAFERCNLVQGKWSLPVARQKAAEVAVRKDDRRVILLGAKVCNAFRESFTPFTMPDEKVRIGYEVFQRRFLILPHPSGLNRLWRNLENIARARAALIEFAPEIAPLIGKGS